MALGGTGFGLCRIDYMLTLYFTVGQVTISGEINFQLNSELNANTPMFTLTCTSTGGPATTVSWRRGSIMLSSTSQIVTSQIVTNTETGTYMNTLRVAMREVGVYTCTVSNNRSSDTRSLTVVGKTREFMHGQGKASQNHT